MGAVLLHPGDGGGLPDRGADPVRSLTDDARFWAKVKVSSECWEWIGAQNPSGHGRFWIRPSEDEARGHNVPAHHWLFEQEHGPLPIGLEIDHLCRNPSCVNPLHLEAVTRGENQRRGMAPWAENARKTHCPQGHPYDEANTCLSGGRRHCRTCLRVRAQAKREAARA